MARPVAVGSSIRGRQLRLHEPASFRCLSPPCRERETQRDEVQDGEEFLDWRRVGARFGSGGNGLFMLASPERWYFVVPGVMTTGLLQPAFRSRHRAHLPVYRDGISVYLMSIFPLPHNSMGSAHAVGFGHTLSSTIGRSRLAFADHPRSCDSPAVTLPATIGTVLTSWAASKVVPRTVSSPQYGEPLPLTEITHWIREKAQAGKGAPWCPTAPIPA